MITVYVSIGNSDNKLGQAEWSEYVADFRLAMERYADQILGEWYSLPDSAYQNACMAVEVLPDDVDALMERLTDVRETYGQASVAWAVAPKTEFI